MCTYLKRTIFKLLKTAAGNSLHYITQACHWKIAKKRKHFNNYIWRLKKNHQKCDLTPNTVIG